MGKGLRIATLTGLVVLLLVEAVRAVLALDGTLHVRGLVLTVALSAAVLLTLRFLLHREAWLIVRRREILFPLALLTVLEHGLLPLVAAVITPFASSTSFSLGALSVGISVTVVLVLLLNIAYSVWASLLVVQALDGPVSLDDPRRGVRGRPGVLATATAIGWTVPFVGVALLLLIVRPLGMTPALLVIAAGSLAWNLGTSVWLVGAAARGWDLPTTIVTGWRHSWSRLRDVGLVVVAQLVLTGWITYLHVSFSPAPGSHTTRTSWHVNAFWTGAYKHGSDWYGQYMGTLDHGQLGFALVMLQLLLGVLALAVRLRVARHVAPVGSTPPQEKPASSEEPSEAAILPGVDYDEY